MMLVFNLFVLTYKFDGFKLYVDRLKNNTSTTGIYMYASKQGRIHLRC